MSVSLCSIESIVNAANRFYRKDAPLMYSQNYHIDLLLNIIGYMIHERRFQVAVTNVPLIEPIYNFDKMIILSKPLIAYYMNQPVAIDRGKVTLERNVDLFGDLLGRARSEKSTNCASFDAADAVRDNAERDVLLSEDDIVRFTHTIRLVVMAAHWYQHYSKSIPYTDHSSFRPIEFANRTLAGRFQASFVGPKSGRLKRGAVAVADYNNDENDNTDDDDDDNDGNDGDDLYENDDGEDRNNGLVGKSNGFVRAR